MKTQGRIWAMARAARALTRRGVLLAAAIAPAAPAAAAAPPEGMIQVWVKPEVWARFLALAGQLGPPA
jgi:hypothetical protein